MLETIDELGLLKEELSNSRLMLWDVTEGHSYSESQINGSFDLDKNEAAFKWIYDYERTFRRLNIADEYLYSAMERIKKLTEKLEQVWSTIKAQAPRDLSAA